jgi:serine/threonine protein kinase
MLFSILCALAAAHANKVVHGSIHPNNIFVRDLRNLEKSNYCLGNFGFAKTFSMSNLLKKPGSVHTIAPETISNKLVPASDIWSLGVCMYMVI